MTSGDYDGCENDIDWQKILEENEKLPKNSQEIFESIVCAAKKKWSNDEIQELRKIKNMSLCAVERAKILKEKFPNRSLKSCISKLNRL